MALQTQTIECSLAASELYSDGFTYRFVKVPLSSLAVAAKIVESHKALLSDMPFLGLLVDKDEVTLMMPHDEYQSHHALLGEHEVGEFSYRLITFDVVLEPTLVGFMALITRTLAAAKISVMPFAAYSRDHIFVAAGDFERAMHVLQDLKASISDEKLE